MYYNGRTYFGLLSIPVSKLTYTASCQEAYITWLEDLYLTKAKLSWIVALVPEVEAYLAYPRILVSKPYHFRDYLFNLQVL